MGIIAGEFGVTKAGERADDGDQHQRESDGRAGSGAPGDNAAGVMKQPRVRSMTGESAHVGHGGGISPDGDADDGEDA